VSILVTELPIVTDDRLQASKAFFPIVMTEFGIVKVVKPSQEQKAPSHIVVIVLGKSTDVSPVQLKNDSSPIIVTELGIVIEVKLLQ